jgi:hypothetical protein
MRESAEKRKIFAKKINVHMNSDTIQRKCRKGKIFSTEQNKANSTMNNDTISIKGCVSCNF